MLALGTSRTLLKALGAARTVWFGTSLLGTRPLVNALEAAAERGARVHVRLERRPYARDPAEAQAMAGENVATVRELRRHGVDARLSPLRGPSQHAKLALVDGTAFFDDRNWPVRGDTILVTNAPRDVARVRAVFAGRHDPGAGRLALRKDEALTLEASVARRAHGDLCVETESVGRCGVVDALLARARSGGRVRAIVGERDIYQGSAGRLNPAVRALGAAGVEVRVAAAPGKLCAGDDLAWVGSANATRQRGESSDWGVRTGSRNLVSALRDRFERAWSAASPVPAAVASQSVLSDRR